MISLARCQAAPGQGDALELRLGELLARARADVAGLGCELERCGEDWQLRGHWVSLRALEAHLQLPHMQALGLLLGDGLVRHLELSLAPHR
nr:hypothetical protein [Pseudomonas sp. UBA6718]